MLIVCLNIAYSLMKMPALEDVDEDAVLCGVCNAEFDGAQRSPQLLPCLHTLCRDCALNASRGSALTCALCKETHTLNADLQLLLDSTMKNMVDVVRVHRKSGNIQCSDCPDDNKGENFCKDCYVFLCPECTSAHKRTQVTRKHAVLTLDELKTSGIGSFTRKELCSVEGHEDQPFSFYCETPGCQRPVCTKCVVGEHSQASGHDIRSLGEVFDENKVHVERLVGELLGKISVISSDAKRLESDANAISEKQSTISKDIDEMFDSFEAALKKRREQLKQRVDVLCKDQKKKLDVEMERLQKSKSNMENACNYSSRMLVFTNKPEFLNLTPTVVTRLLSLLDVTHDVKPPAKFDISFSSDVNRSKFEELVASVGDVQTNVYEDDDASSTPFRVNGTVDVEETFVLPYKGPPIHPPGSFTSPKQSTSKTTRDSRLPKVEPLNLNSITEDHRLQRPASHSRGREDKILTYSFPSITNANGI